MFVGVTTEICAQAWDLIEPSIAHGASTGLLNGPVGSLLVLDPRDNSELFTAHPGGMIHEETLRNARGKAAVALRTGVDAKTAAAIRAALVAGIEYDDQPPGDVLLGLVSK